VGKAACVAAAEGQHLRKQGQLAKPGRPRVGSYPSPRIETITVDGWRFDAE